MSYANTIDDVFIINKASDLIQYLIDLGDGLGLAYRLPSGRYRIGGNLSLAYPIAPTATAGTRIRIECSVLCLLIYTGTGAFIRTNATNKWFWSEFWNIDFKGNGTNDLFNCSGTFAETIRLENCGVTDFSSPGIVSNYRLGKFINNTVLNFTFSGLILSNVIVTLINTVDFSTTSIVGGSYLTITGAATQSVSVFQSLFIPQLADSALDIDVSVVNFVEVTHSQLIKAYGGVPFEPGSLTGDAPNVDVVVSHGFTSSQIIGSLYMERNTTETIITALGVTGDITSIADGETTGSITAFADYSGTVAGTVKVTTNAAHGLTTGDISVQSVTTNYNGTFVITVIDATNYYITATWVVDDATGTWINYKSIVTSATHGKSNGDMLWIIDDDYTGAYNITNVTTDTFDISVRYSTTSTGTWEDNWVKIAGTTLPLINSRASMTDNNELTFTNLESTAVKAELSTNPRNLTDVAVKDWEFAIMKNGARIKGSLKKREMTNKAGEGISSAPTRVIDSDVFEGYVRQVGGSISSMLMVNMTMTVT